MKVIHKYLLEETISMPKGAQILKVSEQHDDIYVWACVDPSQPLVGRLFEMYGTGNTVKEPKHKRYLDTLLLNDGLYVLHVFEVTGEPQ